MRFAQLAVLAASVSPILARAPHRQARRHNVEDSRRGGRRCGSGHGHGHSNGHSGDHDGPGGHNGDHDGPGGHNGGGHNGGGSSHGCKLDKYTPDLPTGLSIPAGQVLVAAVLGVGTQNYTCNSDTLKYVSAGAVAQLFDISCILGTPLESTIEPLAEAAYEDSPRKVREAISKALKAPAIQLGNHFFITNPFATTPAILPEFELGKQGFAIVAKTAGVPATNTAEDVDYLQLTNGHQTTGDGSGDLADTVFRLKTAGGQPPSSCTAGSGPIQVPYAAEYLFYHDADATAP